MGSSMKLTLEAGQLAPGAELPLEIQSISPVGLAILTADEAPDGLDTRLLGDHGLDGESLTFVLEKDGRNITLQANLVWLGLSTEATTGQRLELIVDTGDEAGWWAVHTALAKE